ncbi:U3 snoRNA binding protein, partial [Aureococcus anophagefferens]
MSGEPQTHVAHKSSKGKGFVATRAKQAAAFREGGAGAQRSGNTQKRAFGVANLGRAKRSVQRNADRGHRKEVVPLVQRARTEGAPPVVVVVCGPRGSGKSTLIRSLVKLYTRHNLASVDGPVTITVGKDKRLTLVECPDDLCGMIDLAKVADLVLLTIDASFGFEMVTFEFLAILQAHGFPKVMGVLTHLDKMKTNKALQHVKKALKHRFWADIYAGAKIFYIGGILQSGKYARNETRQLALYVSRVKFRPLTWRNAHGYVLCDRVDDATPPSRLLADPKCDRTVDCYGYVRGAHLKAETRVHVPGLGDFLPSELAPLDDPLPLGKAEATTADGRTKKLLKASETVIYAPMANVGNVDYEDGSVFIDLKTVAYSKDADVEGADDARRAQTGGAAQLVRRLQDLGDGVDGKLGDSTLRLFGSDAGVAASAVDDEDEEEDDDDMEEEDDDDDDESSDSEADGDAAARASFFERTKEDLSRRLAAKNAEDVAAWVYDSDASDGAASDGDDDDDDD